MNPGRKIERIHRKRPAKAVQTKCRHHRLGVHVCAKQWNPSLTIRGFFDSGATLADVLPDSPHFFVAPAVNLEKMRVPVSRTLLFILDLLFSIA